MKWFQNWIDRIVSEANNRNNNPNDGSIAPKPIVWATKSKGRGTLIKSLPHSDNLSCPAINFKIFNGDGGFVIEYNGQLMHSKNGSHDDDYYKTFIVVVPNGEKLGDAVEKVITMQGLRY